MSNKDQNISYIPHRNIQIKCSLFLHADTTYNIDLFVYESYGIFCCSAKVPCTPQPQ